MARAQVHGEPALEFSRRGGTLASAYIGGLPRQLESPPTVGLGVAAARDNGSGNIA